MKLSSLTCPNRLPPPVFLSDTILHGCLRSLQELRGRRVTRSPSASLRAFILLCAVAATTTYSSPISLSKPLLLYFGNPEEGESEMENGYISGSRRSSFASQRHVNYCCGSCGYELNLSSSNRNTATIGSKYGKSIKRGIISFFHIDQSKFTHVNEFRCIPYFISKHSWGLFRQKTKLLCRKCGNHVGYAYDDRTFPYPLVTDGSNSSPVSEISNHIKFEIRIRALQPSSTDQSGTSPFT